jgi:hypothetical protein
MVRVQTMTIAKVNHLFSLPSAQMLFLLLKESWSISLMPVAFIVLTIYVLPLVGTLAPNALSVGSRGKTPFNWTVPVIDYYPNWDFDFYITEQALSMKLRASLALTLQSITASHSIWIQGWDGLLSMLQTQLQGHGFHLTIGHLGLNIFLQSCTSQTLPSLWSYRLGFPLGHCAASKMRPTKHTSLIPTE